MSTLEAFGPAHLSINASWDRVWRWFGAAEQPTKSDPGFAPVVKRQWRATRHPSLFYLGYGRIGNIELYKWHLGLVGGETNIYRLPEGQSGPAVGRWVHIAGVYDVFHQKSGSQISGFDVQQRGRPGLPENQIPKKSLSNNQKTC